VKIMSVSHVQNAPEVLTADQLAHLGEGAIAYVRPIKSEDAQVLFPQIRGLKPGQQLFALLAANGAPILLADSRDAALANAWENRLATVSLH
jgi:hypothetical protein